jgi:glycosyltransferase involved in cell wall biosynthesis
MPSLRTALRLLCHDRDLFRKRLVANLARWADGPFARISGTTPLYRDILPASCAVGSHPSEKRMLIVFSCNPFLPSGVGTCIFAQCGLFRKKGYPLDAVWYVQDEVTRDSRDAFLQYFDRAALIFPKTARQRRTADGVTAICLDEWCGQEAIDVCSNMMRENHYAGLVIHQPWLSRIFEHAPPGVHKYLFMHDNFANRAELFESQGLNRRLAWLSVSEDMQARCLNRADTIFAVQDEERAVFERQARSGKKHVTVTVVFPDKTRTPMPPQRDRLFVGIVASANENNRTAVRDFVRLWERAIPLCAGAELRIAGDICRFLRSKEPSVRLLGRLDDLDAFYADIDVAVNPDCGGTGIKIKSLEALSYGRALLCSPAGGKGLHSDNASHNLPDRESMIRILAQLTERREQLVTFRETSIAVFKRYNEMAEHYLKSF